MHSHVEGGWVSLILDLDAKFGAYFIWNVVSMEFLSMGVCTTYKDHGLTRLPPQAS